MRVLLRRRLPLSGLLVLLLIGLAALAGVPARAQQAAPPVAPATRLDNAKQTLDSVEAALTRSDLSDSALQRLRTRIEPVAADIQGVVAELQPRADAAKARLAQLGPKPEAKDGKPAAEEPADITAERTAQDKLFGDLDATLKRAKVLLVQEDQLDTTIGSMRRSLFTRSVLGQSYSILDPRLWVPVVAEFPSDLRAIRFLATDWYNGVASKIETWQLLAVIVALAIIGALYEPTQRVARRVSARDASTVGPSRLRKVIAALWAALVSAAVPIAAVLIAGLVLGAFDLVNSRLDLIVSACGRGVSIVAVTAGLTRGFLAPRRGNWRLPTISDRAAERLYNLALLVSGLVGITRIIEALNDTISVGLPTAIASRGLLAAIATIAMTITLNRLSADSDEAARSARARAPKGHDWTGVLRLLFWLAVAVLVVALLAGFIAFASFLVTQIVVVTVIGIMLYLLLDLADEGIDASLESRRVLGRAFIQTLGLRRESLDLIGILLSGTVRVVLIAVAILLVLAPWRIESGDMLSTVEAALIGFSIGDVTISLSTIVIAVVLFLVAIGATRGVQRWMEVKFLPHTRLDSGLQNSIKVSFGYCGFIIASALGLSQLGVSFERLAIVAGALSVGIGFGLQSIVNNFVSGLILLWERAVRVGDLVVVGADQGYVRRINVRSTEIETADRATVIVPNSNLVSGVVKNWLRNDRVGRIRLPFTMGFGADPEKVREVLVTAAKGHDHILSIPSPQVLFTTLGEANLQIELLCFIEDIELQARVSSDLLFEIFKGFQAIGLCVPGGPPVVASPVLDKLDAWLSAKVAETPVPLKTARGG